MKVINQKHGFDVGDLVKVRHDPKYKDSGHVGIVQWVSESWPSTCVIIVNGNVSTYDARLLEVINVK